MSSRTCSRCKQPRLLSGFRRPAQRTSFRAARTAGAVSESFRQCCQCARHSATYRCNAVVRSRAVLAAKRRATESNGYLCRLYGALRARCPASLAAPGFWQTLGDFREFVGKQRPRCAHCDIELVFSSRDPQGLDRQVTLDRLKTADTTNLYVPANVVLACRFCQFTRNDATLHHWRDYLQTILAPEGPLREIVVTCPNQEEHSRLALTRYQPYKATLPSEWITDQFDKQRGRSLLGNLPMHYCTGKAQCLFKASIDRIDNAGDHSVGNVWLVTRGEQFGKRTVRDGEPMTIARWARCRDARRHGSSGTCDNSQGPKPLVHQSPRS